MLKKILSFLCLSVVFQGIAFATEKAFYGKAPCLNLVVTVQNHTESMCSLVQHDLFNGRFWDEGVQNIALILPGESRMTKIQEFESVIFGFTELTLSYTCGNAQMVTVKSRKDSCIYGGAVTASTPSLSNMDATYVSSIGSGSALGGRPGTIVWTLS